jgi:hypothetical protein
MGHATSAICERCLLTAMWTEKTAVRGSVSSDVHVSHRYRLSTYVPVPATLSGARTAREMEGVAAHDTCVLLCAHARPVTGCGTINHRRPSSPMSENLARGCAPSFLHCTCKLLTKAVSKCCTATGVRVSQPA